MTDSRIVIVNDESRARGGATVLALRAARDLVARGHQVVWLTGDSGDNPELEALGIEVVALGERALLETPRGRAAISGIHNTTARHMVADFVATRDTPGTIYHVHAWSQTLSPSVFAALAPVAGRTLIHAHDLFLACPNGMFMDYRRDEVCTRVPLSPSCLVTNCDKRSYAHKLWRVARQKALWRALTPFDAWGGILVLHPDMKPRLARAGFSQDGMITLRNPVSPFTPRRIEAETNRGVVYVGRLEADKGVGDLAEAAACTGTPLTLVGDGAMRAEMAARYPDMPITGWVDSDRIGAHVAGARALVMPSRHPEPFALVIAEAAASGLPVVVSDTALMAREVVEAGLGLSFDSLTPGDLEAALERVTTLPDDDIAAMSQRGFSGEVALGHSPEGWIDAMEAEYARLRA